MSLFCLKSSYVSFDSLVRSLVSGTFGKVPWRTQQELCSYNRVDLHENSYTAMNTDSDREEEHTSRTLTEDSSAGVYEQPFDNRTIERFPAPHTGS